MGTYVSKMSAEESICSSLSATSKDYFSELPYEIQVLILLHLDIRSLVQCRLTCQRVCTIISSTRFWYQAALQWLDLGTVRCKALWTATPHWEWSQYAHLCYTRPFGRNFIKNGSGELIKEHDDKPHGYGGREKLLKIAHWRILENGGDGWQVERPPVGCNPLPEHPDIVGHGCFVTSYSTSSKVQLVDLQREVGMLDLFKDVKPHIAVSEWVFGRWDCDSEYEVEVLLLDGDKKSVAEWRETKELGGNFTFREHVQVQHVFQDYPPGVRFVQFKHRGSDRSYWAGWYGAKMTGASVRLVLPPPQ